MLDTIIRMGRDIILLLLPLMAFIGYVAGASVPGAPVLALGVFTLAGAMVGLVMVAVFARASR
jgi:hypothetical protein